MKPRLLDLPQGYQTVIDEADWPRVQGLTLYRGTNGYVYFSTWANGKSHPQTLHRYLVNAPKGTHTDHVNGDKLDNRRANLRVVSPSVNQINRKRLNRNNKSGVRGVQYVSTLCASHPWRAQITANGKNRHLGLFTTRVDALAVRKAAERDLFEEVCP